MDLIYLDYNCFQRGFDDFTQVRIRMEAMACQEIFVRAEANQICLVWSFMHQDETIVCPFPLRKYEALRLATLCSGKIAPTEKILQLARSFHTKDSVAPKDALHLACAVEYKVDYFLTCDDKFMKRAQKLNLVTVVMNPIDYVRTEKE